MFSVSVISFRKRGAFRDRRVRTAYQRVLGRLHENGVDLPVSRVVTGSVSWAHGETGGASSAASTEALQRR